MAFPHSLQAHNLKVVSSNLAPATNTYSPFQFDTLISSGSEKPGQVRSLRKPRLAECFHEVLLQLGIVIAFEASNIFH